MRIVIVVMYGVALLSLNPLVIIGVVGLHMLLRAIKKG